MPTNTHDAFLRNVVKPARYIGGEWNSMPKDWGDVRGTCGAGLPRYLRSGHVQYGHPNSLRDIKQRHGVLAERVYAPWPDMEEQLRLQGLPLYSLETRRPLQEFDIIGFSMGYELSCTTVLNMLDLAGLPVFSRDTERPAPADNSRRKLCYESGTDVRLYRHLFHR